MSNEEIKKLSDYCQARRDEFLSAVEHGYFWAEHDRTVYETAADIYRLMTGEEFTPANE